MLHGPVFIAFMLFGLKLDHVSPWDGTPVVVTSAPKLSMERVDPYSGSPLASRRGKTLVLSNEDPWSGEVSF